MNKTLKNILIVFGCLVVVLCVGVNVWWFYVMFFSPDKIISNTYEVGLQTVSKEEEEKSKYFIEINYLSNEEGNGEKLFEVKFNYMLDENQESFYSQGLQFVGDFEYEYKIDESEDPVLARTVTRWPIPCLDYFNRWGGYRLSDSSNCYNYASGDDYDSVIMSTNPISTQTRFKIQLGDDLYLMEFKNKYTEDLAKIEGDPVLQYEGDTRIYVLWTVQQYYSCYAYKDYNYFCKLLSDAVKTLPSGTNRAMIFEFGDLFNYYKYDSNLGQYTKVDAQENEKIALDVKSYYSIKVTTSARGMQQATDSMFGAVNGSTTYNQLTTYTDDYFVGRTYLAVTEKAFDLVQIETGYCLLKLKESFVKLYGKYDTLILKVNVDLDGFIEDGINILGFSLDSGLSNFNVGECYFLQTVNGEILRTGVDYV